MRIIRNDKNEFFQELEVERTYLFFIKCRALYRRFSKTIYRYTPPNNYYTGSASEILEVMDLFLVDDRI